METRNSATLHRTVFRMGEAYGAKHFRDHNFNTVQFLRAGYASAFLSQ